MRHILFALIVFTVPLTASISCPLNTAQTLTCRFSTHQHNRILIEGGRIKKVIFPEEKLHVRMEETSGQVFIQAKTHIQEKIIVSVISQSGIVQDIEIEFTDRSSQVVILQEPVVEPRQYTRDAFCLQCPSEDLSSLVGTILQNKVPEGFVSVPITHFSKTIRSGMKAKLVGRLRGCGQDLYIYQIHNARIWKKCLLERDLTCCGALWVYLQQTCLEAKETVLAVVAVQT